VPAAAKNTQKAPRRDPRPRHINGSAIWSMLTNRDPGKFYVYVNKGDPEALANYEWQGYEVEVLRKDGVRPVGGRTVTEGQPIEVRGMILHSISLERHAELELHGSDGESGQSGADEIESRIIDRSGRMDPLRGQYRGLTVVNETTAPTAMVQHDG
jgi:hypothetical protein